MKANTLIELECFQDLNKNKYIHPFYQTNKGHLIISGDLKSQNDYILGYILRRIPSQYSNIELKILMYSKSINESQYPKLSEYFKKPIISTRDDLMSLLIWVKKTMNNRYKLFRELKAKDNFAFNERVVKQEINKRIIPYLLLIIHEVPETKEVENDSIHDLIHQIIIKSRAAGIHLIATSSIIINSISPVFKHNMDGIISMVDTIEKSKILVGSDDAKKIKSNEVMIHRCLTGKNTKLTLFDEPEKRLLLHKL